MSVTMGRQEFYEMIYKRRTDYAQKLDQFKTETQDFFDKMKAVIQNQTTLKAHPFASKSQMPHGGICRYSDITHNFEIYFAEGPYTPAEEQKFAKSHISNKMNALFGYASRENQATFLAAKLLKKPGSWDKFMNKVLNGQMRPFPKQSLAAGAQTTLRALSEESKSILRSNLPLDATISSIHAVNSKRTEVMSNFMANEKAKNDAFYKACMELIDSDLPPAEKIQKLNELKAQFQ